MLIFLFVIPIITLIIIRKLKKFDFCILHVIIVLSLSIGIGSSCLYDEYVSFLSNEKVYLYKTKECEEFKNFSQITDTAITDTNKYDIVILSDKAELSFYDIIKNIFTPYNTVTISSIEKKHRKYNHLWKKYVSC